MWVFCSPALFYCLLPASLAGGGVLDIWSMLLAGFIGAVLGDSVSFILGQVFHRHIRGWWPFRSHPKWLEQGEEFFHKHGGISIALGRFIGPIRPVIPVVAGMLNMPARYFYLVNILSSLVWSPVYLIPGYLVGASVYWQEYLPVSLISVLAGMLGLAWLIAFSCRFWGNRYSLDTAISYLLGGLIFFGLASKFFWFSSLDLWIQKWTLSVQTPLIYGIFADITLLGDRFVQTLWVLLVAVWLIEDGNRKKCGQFLLLAISVHGLNVLLKLLLATARPEGVTGPEAESYSWPSGHASFVMFTGLVLGRYFSFKLPARYRPWFWWAGLSLGLLVGFSRIYLNVHWFTDVVGGVLQGSAGFVIWLVLDRSAGEYRFSRSFWWRGCLLILASAGVLMLVR